MQVFGSMKQRIVIAHGRCRREVQGKHLNPLQKQPGQNCSPGSWGTVEMEKPVTVSADNLNRQSPRIC
ncbi:hypothetical protein QL093DRAFT_2332853, partial [Fusarium oxysporum]